VVKYVILLVYTENSSIMSISYTIYHSDTSMILDSYVGMCYALSVCISDYA